MSDDKAIVRSIAPESGACHECERYRKALAAILALIARMAGGMTAEIRVVAEKALRGAA